MTGKSIIPSNKIKLFTKNSFVGGIYISCVVFYAKKRSLYKCTCMVYGIHIQKVNSQAGDELWKSELEILSKVTLTPKFFFRKRA